MLRYCLDLDEYALSEWHSRVRFKNKRQSVGERSVGFGKVWAGLADRQFLQGTQQARL